MPVATEHNHAKNQKRYQFQLILGDYESIIWHCGHEHKTRQEARECGRKNAPEVAERTVEFEHSEV